MHLASLALALAATSATRVHHRSNGFSIHGLKEDNDTTAPAPEKGSPADPAEVKGISTSTKLWAWMGGQMLKIDPKAAEKKLREEQEGVLLKGEEVVHAFKRGKDKTYFTDKRILIRPKGYLLTAKKTIYQSIPYTSILAFSARTAGRFLDFDTELKIWTSMPRVTFVGMKFRKRTRASKQDVMELKEFLNEKVFGPSAAPAKPAAALADSLVEESNGLAPFWSDNAKQLEPAAFEAELRNTTRVIMADETVTMVFKARRDYTVFTSKRLLIIDVHGFSGKTEYRSFPYSTIKAYSVQSAGGGFDTDSDLFLWTNIPQFEMRQIAQDFKKDIDILAIKALLNDKILGITAPSSLLQVDDSAATAASAAAQEESLPGWFSDDMSQMDPATTEKKLREWQPKLLQSDERVVIAYKERRDQTVFTSKRMIIIDVQGFSGKKVEYRSIPYTSMSSFAVRSAGGYFDRDAELMIWTDIMHNPPPPPTDEEPHPPPTPGMSFLEQDLRASHVNIFDIQKLLSQKLVGNPTTDSFSLADVGQTSEGPSDWYQYFSDNGKQVDPAHVDKLFHTDLPILLPDERVEMAFKTRNDYTLLTSQRMLILDRQSAGKKTMYMSMLYKSVRAFSVETAGFKDSDAEFDLYTTMPWKQHYDQDLQRGMVDLVALQAYFCRRLLSHSNSYSSFVERAGPFFSSDNMEVMDPKVVEAEVQKDTPILQKGEEVKLAFKKRSDMTVLTTDRILHVDVTKHKGKTEFITIPYSSVAGFQVTTAANSHDRDEELTVYTTMLGYHTMEQDIVSGTGMQGIFGAHALLASKIGSRKDAAR